MKTYNNVEEILADHGQEDGWLAFDYYPDKLLETNENKYIIEIYARIPNHSDLIFIKLKEGNPQDINNIVISREDANQLFQILKYLKYDAIGEEKPKYNDVNRILCDLRNKLGKHWHDGHSDCGSVMDWIINNHKLLDTGKENGTKTENINPS